jgi:hypothetical protein
LVLNTRARAGQEISGFGALIQPTDLTRLERFFAALVLVPSTMGSSGIAFLAIG